MTIPRIIRSKVIDALARQAAVCLLGPRQVGKTTLALQVSQEASAIYLDLESSEDRQKLTDPLFFLRAYEDRLVILDEIHRAPEIFQSLRVLIDEGRRKNRRTGRFLILGSASIELLKQSSESLAGRIEYLTMSPFNELEVVSDELVQRQLWLRGGFPDSFLSNSDLNSFKLRKSFVRTYLERDVAQFGMRIPAETLERLWTMIAHGNGTLLNASKLAAALSLSAPTITNYVDLLSDLFLIRRLPPLHANVGKRLVKSPKVYVRDSGILHALLNLKDFNELSGHPIVGASWEGFVIENLLSVAPDFSTSSFYRTAAGAEIDLVLEMPGKIGTWAIEAKLGLVPKVEKGFHLACDDLKPKRRFVVYSGSTRFPMPHDVEAIGLFELCQLISEFNE